MMLAQPAKEPIPAFIDAVKYQPEDGTFVYMLWDILNDAGARNNVDFWDYAAWGKDFDKWCDSKGYGLIDPKGKKRQASNIWFAEQEKEIAAGNWVQPGYFCFVDFLTDHYFHNPIVPDDEDWEEDLDTAELRAMAQQFDLRDFNKDGWRVALTDVLVKELGAGVRVVAA